MNIEEQARALMQRGLQAQHLGDYDAAIAYFDAALEVDPRRETAHNSKGLTLKMAGRYDQAIVAYELCLDAVFSNLFYRLSNTFDQPIFPFRKVSGNKWASWAIKTGLYTSCHMQGITAVEWPSGESAENEVLSRSHGGLFWIDRQEKAGLVRTFLPNYFHTIRELLKAGKTYSRVLNNIGGVHLVCSRTQEAIALFFESIAFIPDGDAYDGPYIALYDLKRLN
jgi:tetratricopeptide (TPR) repeat protein